MWPTVVAAIVVDAVTGSLWPVAGDSQSWAAAGLSGAFLTLLALVIGMPLGQRLIRRLRPDLPKLIARDYAGTGATALVTVGLLAAGLVHQRQVGRDRFALHDATARAEEYIGVHAPIQFQREMQSLDVYALQPPRLYRVCVSNRARTRDYCVIVDRSKSLAHDVRRAGSEPNSLLMQGAY